MYSSEWHVDGWLYLSLAIHYATLAAIHLAK